MDNDPDLGGNEGENVLLHKRFQVTFEIDADFLDTPVHPDDETYIHLLRDQILSDAELASKMLLCQAVDTLELDLSQFLANSGFYDSTGNEIVESKARFLPSEAIYHLFSVYLGGLGFADELGGESTRCNVSSVSFLDMDRCERIHIDPMPEPFFAIKAYEDCLLARNQTEWIAAMRVRLNYFTAQEIEASIKKALKYIDQIYEHVNGDSLPLNKIEIGVIAADTAEYEMAISNIKRHIYEKMPGINIDAWFRQKDRIKSLNLMDIFRMQGK